LLPHEDWYNGVVDQTSVPWLDDDEMRAWRGMIDVFTDVHASLEADLIDRFGITEGDYGVLANLSEAPGRRLRMCDLAARLHLSPSGLTRRLDGLVKLGYVAREPSEADRRVTLAVLTNAGYATLEAAAPVHVEGVRRALIDNLTRTQIRQLGAAFDAVRRRRARDTAAESA
jgi:DNA-binding MarR family transcriptional regulator